MPHRSACRGGGLARERWHARGASPRTGARSMAHGWCYRAALRQAVWVKPLSPGWREGSMPARIAAMGRAWTRKPGRPLPAIFLAGQKAACRLLSNPRAAMQHVLQSRFEATAEHIESVQVDGGSESVAEFERSATPAGRIRRSDNARPCRRIMKTSTKARLPPEKSHM